MRKLFIFTFLFITSHVHAQVEQGDLSATFNFSFLSIDGTGTAIISTKAGYYINNNVELGASPLIILGSGFSQVNLSVFGTYNFLTADAKLLPYAGASLGLIVQSFQTGFSDVPETEANPSYGLYAGSKYFISEKLFADANMNLSGSGVGTIFSINLGVGFLIGKLR